MTHAEGEHPPFPIPIREEVHIQEIRILVGHIYALGSRNELAELCQRTDGLLDKIHSVKELWERLQSGWDGRAATHLLLEPIIRYTGWCIFHSGYQNIPTAVRNSLSTAVKGVAALVCNSDIINKFCSVLVILCISPWDYHLINKLWSGTHLTAEVMQSVWDTEGIIFLQSTLEILGLKPQKLRSSVKIVVRILQVLLAKGSDLCKASGELKASADFATRGQYIGYLQLQILMCIEYRHSGHVDIKNFQGLCPGALNIAMRDMDEIFQSKRKGKLFPHLWEGKSSDDLLAFVEELLPALFGRDHGCGFGIRRFINFAITLYKREGRSTPRSPIPKRLQMFLSGTLFLEKCKKNYKADYIYLLAEEILIQFPTGSKVGEMYVYTYITGIYKDISIHFQYNVQRDTEGTKRQNLQISSRLLILSRHFECYPKTSECLKLASFSRNPSVALFEEIFGGYSPTPSCSEDEDELPASVLEDLGQLCHYSRHGSLPAAIPSDKAPVMATCQRMLESNFNPFDEPELEFAFPQDYEKFSHLEQQYDDDSFGTEKNFYVPNINPPRKKRKVSKKPDPKASIKEFVGVSVPKEKSKCLQDFQKETPNPHSSEMAVGHQRCTTDVGSYYGKRKTEDNAFLPLDQKVDSETGKALAKLAICSFSSDRLLYFNGFANSEHSIENLLILTQIA